MSDINVFVVDTPRGKYGFLNLFDVAAFCSIVNLIVDVKVVGYSNTKGFGYWETVADAVEEYKKES